MNAFGLLKSWYKMTLPNKLTWFKSFFTMTLVQASYVLIPIFAAQVTICLTSNPIDYNGAILNLILGFAIILVRGIILYYNYWIYSRLLGEPYLKFNNKLVDKITSATTKSLKKTSKERILNVLSNDIYLLCDYSDRIATIAGKGIRVIVTVASIFFINWLAGLIVLIVDITNFVIIANISLRQQKTVNEIKINTDMRCQKMSQLIDARDVVRDLNVKEKLKDEFSSLARKFIKLEHKRVMYNNYQDPSFVVYYQFIILLVTLLMVSFVSQGTLTITLYFIIIPYITNGIEIAKEMTSTLRDLNAAVVSGNRLHAVLRMTSKEMAEFGDIDCDNILGLIDFKNVTVRNKRYNTPSINDFSFHLQPYEITLIHGPKNCGKRTIFNILRREITPQFGQVLIDGIDIKDYSKSSHLDNFTYVTSKPFFFKGSILKNLRFVNKNNQEILSVLETLGLNEYIQSLPRKYKTECTGLPVDKLYLLAFARAILTKCEIVAFYEFPSQLSEDDITKIKQLIVKFNEQRQRTFIIFSNNDDMLDISNKIIQIEKSNITGIYFNKTNHKKYLY